MGDRIERSGVVMRMGLLVLLDRMVSTIMKGYE